MPLQKNWKPLPWIGSSGTRRWIVSAATPRIRTGLGRSRTVSTPCIRCHPRRPTPTRRRRMTTDARAAGTFTIRGQLEVVRLGFGAMRITGHGIWGPPRDHDEAIRVLRRADELGINLIDTADSYGPGVSEELIAEALHPYPEGLVVATKAGFARPGPGRWVEDGRPEHLREAVEGSLARLRLERIDLLQLHRIDPKVPADDQLGTLKELRERGQIWFIGLSEVSVDQREHARTIVD